MQRDEFKNLLRLLDEDYNQIIRFAHINFKGPRSQKVDPDELLTKAMLCLPKYALKEVETYLDARLRILGIKNEMDVEGTTLDNTRRSQKLAEALTRGRDRVREEIVKALRKIIGV
jgi:hypothetical protein